MFCYSLLLVHIMNVSSFYIMLKCLMVNVDKLFIYCMSSMCTLTVKVKKNGSITIHFSHSFVMKEYERQSLTLARKSQTAQCSKESPFFSFTDDSTRKKLSIALLEKMGFSIIHKLVIHHWV